jgi:uncharacterized protein (TIGR02246 family)
MPRFAPAIIALLLATVSAHAQNKLDQETVRNLPQAFCAAFSRHDGHQLAQLMADDLDFVVVGATLIHGRPDFEKYHTRLLSGRFHDMKLEPLQVASRFLGPDVDRSLELDRCRR